MALRELNQAAIWWAAQSAKGTAATVASKKGRWVGGNMAGQVSMGEEPYATGDRFNSTLQYPDELSGGGSPAIQGQTGALAHLLWSFLGTDTVTGTGPYTHTITPGAVSKYMTWWTSVGAAGGAASTIRRHADCRTSQVVIAGATDQKVLRITPTVISLDPDEVITSAPVKADDNTQPLLYTEGSASYTINGTVFPGHSSFAITLSDSLTPVYGDRLSAFDVAAGLGNVELSASIYLDATAQAFLNTVKYGTATPTSGTKPQTVAPTLGTYSFNIARTSPVESIAVTFAGVSWSIPDEPDPAPTGGTPVLTLAGRGAVSGSNPIVSFAVKNADNAAYTV